VVLKSFGLLGIEGDLTVVILGVGVLLLWYGQQACCLCSLSGCVFVAL
jgi:hypothetical protein